MITEVCKSFAQGLWGSLEQWSRGAECVACLWSTIHCSVPFSPTGFELLFTFYELFLFGRKKGKIIYFLSFPLSHGRLAVQSSGEGSSDIVNNVLSEFL